ncbi:MAG TPA: hypothetical protein VOB72_21495 [Candidatus Dormibacteraeota bacterium]|nr:hypothetical protein [Candidatus Dormibacteraeota bacterium]
MSDIRRTGPWEQYRRQPAPAPAAPTTETMRGTCFCLLYDLCCWLATVRRPVPTDVDEYTLTALREIDDPRQRLGRYVNPALLQSWERALQQFFASGATLEPELGEAGSFQERGRDAAGRLRAELRFGNRSSVLDRSQRRHQLPPHDWILTVLLSPDSAGFVENASIRRA